MTVAAKIRGLKAKRVSWVFITSFAVSGEETTMVETSPSCRCIRGPCFLAKSLRPRKGREPANWCKFPMKGSFHGPGGRFETELLDFDPFLLFRRMNTKKKKVKSAEKDEN
ncbi:unnamed protein product [Ilex paraguariensis]|uniref:Secreted protein n=1 Tax=Ilex paraguariensis TaxID=185542 RepID=A0ABC8TIT4_9AQUA